MGRAKQKERERKRAAASCQRLDKLFSSKRNKTVESESEILRQSDNDTPHSSDHSDVRTSTGNYYIKSIIIMVRLICICKYMHVKYIIYIYMHSLILASISL